MNGKSAAVWQRTSPLAAVFFVGRIVKAIAQNAFQALAPIAALAVAAEGSVIRNAMLAITVLLIGVPLTAVLRYLFFRFCIDGDSILVRDGILRKKQLDIRFDRIQAVNTDQNLLYRPFDLVNMRFDTAGSSGQEGFLPAVSADFARDLEARLERHPQQVGTDDEDRDDARAAADAAQPETLREYGARDLLTIGLTSNRALILLALAAPLIERLFGWYVDTIFVPAVPGGPGAVFDGDATRFAVAAASFAGILLLLLVLASIGGAVLRYFRFRLTADHRRFRAVGGLLTRHEHSVRYTKIQALYLYQNPLQRLAGVFRVGARQAASDRKSAESSFTVPLVEPPLLGVLTDAIFSEDFPDASLDPAAAGYSPVARHYVFANALQRGVLPAVAAALVFSQALGWAAVVLLAWIPIAWLYFSVSYRRLGVRVRRDGLSLRRGVLGRRVIAIAFRKVQRVTLSQSPFQRRRRLATLKLFLASGALRVPHVHLDDAARLRDYILFRVETDSRAWH